MDKNIEAVSFTPKQTDNEDNNHNMQELSDIVRALNDRVNKLERRIAVLES